MHFGLQLPTWCMESISARDCIALARQAEEAGFHSVWIGDHLLESPQLRCLGGDGQLEAFTTLGAVAASTSTILVGSCVVIPIRTPINTWVGFATLSNLADGRLVIGLGAGGFEAEFKALHINWYQRGRLLDELLCLLHDWPSAEDLDESLRGWSGPIRPEKMPPVWIGTSGLGARSLRRVAEHASGWFLTYPTVEEYGHASQYLTSLLERAGRRANSVLRSALFRCCLSQDAAEAWTWAKQMLIGHDRALSQLVSEPSGPAERAHRHDSEELASLRERHLIGDPGDIAARLREYEENGLEHAVISFLPPAASCSAVELSAKTVLPALGAQRQ